MRATTLNWAQSRQKTSDRAFNHSLHVFKKHTEYKKNFVKKRNSFIHKTINTIMNREKQLKRKNFLKRVKTFSKEEIGSHPGLENPKRPEKTPRAASNEPPKNPPRKKTSAQQPRGKILKKPAEPFAFPETPGAGDDAQTRGAKAERAGYA